MRYAYPCVLEEDEEGWFVVTFPDVSQAVTAGQSKKEALTLAQDALATALGGYVKDGIDIPTPVSQKSKTLVTLPPVVAAKLALYTAMREHGVSKAAMARQLDVTENVVRRLVNPDHRSHIDKVLKALELLDQTLVLETRRIA